MFADNLPAMAQRTATIRQSASHSGKRYTKMRLVANDQGIAIFGSIFRNTVNPAQFGVVLTYALHAALGRLLFQTYLSELTGSPYCFGPAVCSMRARDGEYFLSTVADLRTT